MKTLILVRHAKSDWTNSLKDHDRPLNDRGLKTAPEMGQRLANRNVSPDIIVSSSANRAHTTACLIANELHYEKDGIRIEPNLYASSAQTWLSVITQLPDNKNCAILFGHNPEITSVVSKLTEEYHEMATCTVAQLSYQIDSWQDVLNTLPIETIIDYPKKPYQV